MARSNAGKAKPCLASTIRLPGRVWLRVGHRVAVDLAGLAPARRSSARARDRGLSGRRSRPAPARGQRSARWPRSCCRLPAPRAISASSSAGVDRVCAHRPFFSTRATLSTVMKLTRWLASRRDAGDVRGQDDVGDAGEHLAGLGLDRLVVEHVERRAAEMAALQRRRAGRLIDDAAACRIDEDGALLHARQLLRRADHAARLGIERAVDGHHVGLASSSSSDTFSARFQFSLPSGR